MFNEKLSNHSEILEILDRIEKIRIQRKMPKGNLYLYSGLSASAVSQWRSGKTKPSYESIVNIADALEVPISEILGEEETKNAPAENGKRNVSDDDIKFALFGGDGEITDEMYEEVRNFAAFVKSREAKKKEK